MEEMRPSLKERKVNQMNLWKLLELEFLLEKQKDELNRLLDLWILLMTFHLGVESLRILKGFLRELVTSLGIEIETVNHRKKLHLGF